MDAPWRAPGADPTDFFNYGQTLRGWREYAARIARYRLEFTMQRKIQTVDGGGGGLGAGSGLGFDMADADLPPELVAALREERGGGGPGFGRPGFGRPGFGEGFPRPNGMALAPPRPPPGVRAAVPWLLWQELFRPGCAQRRTATDAWGAGDL